MADIKSYNNTSVKDCKNTEYLPKQWTLYRYDKHTFKKMASNRDEKAIVTPFRVLCHLNTVADAVYLMKLMAVEIPEGKGTNIPGVKKINLDCNDYVVMRDGIEPIWEDPKNCNGGIFTLMTKHERGYYIWVTLLMYILGETLTDEMEYINGISVTFLTGQNVHGSKGVSSYIKIWDGKPGRTLESFCKALPASVIEDIKGDSLRYTTHNAKADYGSKSVMEKLENSKKHSFGSVSGGFTRGGFSRRGYNTSNSSKRRQ